MSAHHQPRYRRLKLRRFGSEDRREWIRSCAHSSFGIVVMVAKPRIHPPAGERQVSHRPARAIKRRFANVNCMDLYSGRRRHGAYLVRLNSSDPLSGPPTLAIPDPAASSQTLARIGPNGPNVCCSDVKPSAYAPYGVSIGFWSRIGKSLYRGSPSAACSG